MKKITFLGAAGTVTGSAYFLTDQTDKGIMIDLGMFQGSHEINSFNYESIALHPKNVQAVFLTHAHLDHCGRLPLLHRLGYRGPIYMTEATRDLIELTLQDAAAVAAEHMERRSLFNEEDVSWVLRNTVAVQYHEPVKAGKFTVTFRDAGHILGSSFLDISSTDAADGISRIIFSGDIGNYPEPLVRPTETVPEANVVIMESTYGDRLHSKEDASDVLTEEICAIEETGGTLLIPAFSIERSQELLHIIDHLKKNNKIKKETLVFFDSPLAIHVTQVYEKFRTLYGEELSEHAKNDDPFTFPGLVMIEKHSESVKVDTFQGPKVIIAGAGMMTGGRIIRHAKEYLYKETTRLLFVGFQAEETLGRVILEGAKTVYIDGVDVPIKAHIRKSSGLSSHADQGKLLKWFSAIKKVSSVCLTHGEDPQRKVLSAEIAKQYPKVAVFLPKKGETISFGSDQPKYTYYGASGRKRR